MTTNASPERDTRLDVLRALALLTIFVNHVPGTAFEHFTHRNLGFSDAAEAFVLISGIAVGLAYGLKHRPGTRLATAFKAWRRASVLYVTHIVTTMATLALFAGAAIWLARPDLLAIINIGPLMETPAEALFGLVTLGHQLGYNNILSIYAVLLLMVPLFLLIGERSLSLMVSVSGALWLAAGLWQVAPPNYPTEGVWFLNPLSWQFLFVIGMAAVLHVRRSGAVRYSPVLAAIAAAYLLFSLAWVRVGLWGHEAATGMPAVIGGFDKTFLSAPRLLHVLAIAYLIVAVPAVANLFRLQAAHPLAVLGRYALPVFVCGTVLAMAAQIAKTVLPASIGLDASLIIIGVVLQFGLAYGLDWVKSVHAGAAHPAPTLPARLPAAVPAFAKRAVPETGAMF